MPNDNSWDLVGVGRAMEAVPREAWLEIVRTATEVFKSLIKPLTATTGGVGRWIDQKFDNMVEVEKVLLADGLLKAVKRIEASARSVNPKPNLAVIAPLIEGVSLANEAFTREMWINLLSRELSEGEIHPEFVNLLKRLSPSDAILLVEIAKDSEGRMAKVRAERDRARQTRTGIVARPVVKRFNRDFDLRDEVLESLNLVESDRARILTEFAERFLEAVGELARSPS